PTIAWPSGLRYVKDEAAGEVQTPLRGRNADRLQIGDTVWLRHAKAGEPAERVVSYAVVRRENGTPRVVDEWPTYRGEEVVTV
ncbi:MAG: amino acid deaminase/aldolase, partial [bacterium]|nr:amino acid deaminase/aldolase [bacterium]